MSVYKRGKYWIVQFNHNKKTYTRSSKSTRKRDALELERQMRQQLVDTQVLGHREHIKLHEACDALLSTSKDSGAYYTLVTATNRFKDYFDDIVLDEITNRDLSRWVEYERMRGIKDITIRLWSRQFNKICRNANRLGYYTPDYEWGEWNIKDKPIRYLTDDEEQKILKELDPSSAKDPKHKKGRQAARDIFILMVDGGFRINEASIMQWSDIDFDNGDVSSHNMRKTFATRLLSRGAAITDVQHLLGHASVKTTERAYAAFVKNERFKQTIDLLDEPKQPKLKIVK